MKLYTVAVLELYEGVAAFLPANLNGCISVCQILAGDANGEGLGPAAVTPI